MENWQRKVILKWLLRVCIAAVVQTFVPPLGFGLIGGMMLVTMYNAAERSEAINRGHQGYMTIVNRHDTDSD